MTTDAPEDNKSARLRYMNGVAQLKASRGPDLGFSFERAVQIVAQYQNEYQRTSGAISGEEREVRRILRELHSAEAALRGYRDKSAYTAEACHPFHLKAATRTGAKLPPIGA